MIGKRIELLIGDKKRLIINKQRMTMIDEMTNGRPDEWIEWFISE